MASKPLRLAVVDNDRVALTGLCAIITRSLPRVQVIWTETDGRRAIEKAMDPLHAVDVMLVDMSLEDMPGTAVCRETRAHMATPMAILAVTAFSLNHYALAAAEAGAQGIVGKTDFRQLCDAVACVASGGVYAEGLRDDAVRFDTVAEAMKRLVRSEDSQEHQLSEREREVVELYAKSVRPADIGRKLGVKASTIKTMLDRAQEKMGLHSRAELVDEWWRRQW